MLAYPLDEAETLLESKLKTAQQTLANCDDDLDFLRQQITVRQLDALYTLVCVLTPSADHGGGHCAGIQLGGGPEEER